MTRPSDQIDPAVLGRLLEADGPLTLDALAAELGTADAGVRRGVEALRAAGCAIDEHPQQGVRLVRASIECWADFIEARHAGGLGRRLIVYRQTTSTQDAARRLLRGRSARRAGTVVVADHQSAGRGRVGRRWEAPAGSSLLLTALADVGVATVDRVIVSTCCAAAEAVERVGGPAVRVRWPNDLLIAGRKVAGILVERVGGLALVGLGLNVSAAPADRPRERDAPPLRATCLADHGVAADRLQLLDVMLDRLEAGLGSADDAALREAWRARSCLLQQRVTVRAEGRELTGRVIDLDPRQGLLLEVERGPVVTLPAATTTLVL